MGRRRTVQATLREPAASPPSPNETVAQVTVDLRVAYPPGAVLGQLEEMVYLAARQVVRELRHRADNEPHLPAALAVTDRHDEGSW